MLAILNGAVLLLVACLVAFLTLQAIASSPKAGE